jgi:uncharacterized SAM-binding protein YcdF (DUF218 family)
MDTALIVLGNPPEADGTIPYNLKTRLDVAIDEYRKNPGSKVILSGGPAHGNLIEAEEMEKYCSKKGIPDDDIMQEKKSLSTYDNALYTAELLHTEKPGKIILITSRFHKRRADIIFRNYFDQYSISVPELTAGYFIRNLYLYIWEFYLTVKLIIKGDKRLDRKEVQNVG